MTSSNEQDNFDRLAGLQGGENSQPPSAPKEPVAQSSTNSPPVGQGSSPSQPQNGKGTAALVLGIIGMIPFPVTGFWCSLLAIIFGANGRKRARNGLATNNVQATWGMWLGIAGMGMQTLLAIGIAFS